MSHTFLLGLIIPTTKAISTFNCEHNFLQYKQLHNNNTNNMYLKLDLVLHISKYITLYRLRPLNIITIY